MNSNEENNRHNIPDRTSTKAMDSKRDVEKSPDEKTDEDFPGYPHYPASEDMMSQSTGSHRVDANLEEMSAGSNNTGIGQRYGSGQPSDGSQASEPTREETTENAGLDGTNEEIGTPQNVENRDVQSGNDLPGTDVDEAAEKGSLNP